MVRQSEFAVKFLETMLLANEEKLQMIHVKLPCYGRIALDGNHISYTKRMFNGLIERAIKEELEIFVEEGNTDVGGLYAPTILPRHWNAKRKGSSSGTPIASSSRYPS